MAIRTWYLNFPSPSPLSGVTLKNVFFSVVTTVITFQLLSLFCFIFLFPSAVSQNCLPKKLCLFSQACPTLWPHGLWPARLLCPRDSPGKNTAADCHALLQEIFPTQGSNPGLPHCRWILYRLSHQGSPSSQPQKLVKSLSRVWLFLTWWTVACQVPPSTGFSRQEYWSALLFPSPETTCIKSLVRVWF